MVLRITAVTETQVVVEDDVGGVFEELLLALMSDIGEHRLAQLIAGRPDRVALSPRLRADLSVGRRVAWNLTRLDTGASATVAADELEHLFDVAYEMRRMYRMEHFPLGCTLADGRFSLTVELRGGPDRGMYRGIDRTTGASVLVTLAPPLVIVPDVVTRALRFESSVVTPLLHVGPLESTAEAAYAGMVEAEPAGRPASEALVLPLELSRALGISMRLGAGIEDVHAGGGVLRGLRPELVYLDDSDSLVAFAPRCEAFVAAASRREYGVASCFEHTYVAPEVLANPDARLTAAADVFSLCAMLAHWITGEHPYEGRGADQVVSIATGRRRPWSGPAVLGALFDAGLQPVPAERATLPYVLGLLSDLVMATR